MEVLIYGSADRLERLANHPILQLGPTLRSHDEPLPEFLGVYELVIDLNFDQVSELAERLAELPRATLLLSAVEHALHDTLAAVPSPVAVAELAPRAFGLNALPGFVERPVWELALLTGQTPAAARARLAGLPVTCQFVYDQVGMVTPRVICRIINEAYLLLEERLVELTAGQPELSPAQLDALTAEVKAGIDQAMQLGVNYPQGPFAWAEQIGLDTVARVLQRLAQVLGPEAYGVSRLLTARPWPRPGAPCPCRCPSPCQDDRYQPPAAAGP